MRRVIQLLCETPNFKTKIGDSGYSKTIKQSILKLYEEIGSDFT